MPSGMMKPSKTRSRLMVSSSSLVPCWSHQSVQAFRLGAVAGAQNRPEDAALMELLILVGLQRAAGQILHRGGPGRPEGVVLQEPVAVEQVDLPHRGLGDQVQDEGAGTAQAHDRDPLALRLPGHRLDAGPAGGGVEVEEDRVVLLDALHDRERGRGHPRVQGEGGGGDDGRIGVHLLEVVLVPARGRLAGEHPLHERAVGEGLAQGPVDDPVQQPALDVARRLPAPLGHVVLRREGDVARQTQPRHQDPVADRAIGSHVGDVAQEQVPAHHVDRVPLLQQAPQVGTTTCQSR